MSQEAAYFDFEVNNAVDDVLNFQIGFETEQKPLSGDGDTTSKSCAPSDLNNSASKAFCGTESENRQSFLQGTESVSGNNVGTEKFRNVKREGKVKGKKQGSSFSIFPGAAIRRGLSSSRSRLSRSKSETLSTGSRRDWLNYHKKEFARRSNYEDEIEDKLNMLSSSFIGRLSKLRIFLGQAGKQNLGEELLDELSSIRREALVEKDPKLLLSKEGFLFVSLKCYGEQIDIGDLSKRHDFFVFWSLLASRETEGKIHLKDLETFSLFFWQNYDAFVPEFDSVKTKPQIGSGRKGSLFDEKQIRKFLRNSIKRVKSFGSSAKSRISNIRNRFPSSLSYSSFEEDEFAVTTYSPSDNVCRLAFKLFDLQNKGQMGKLEFEDLIKTVLTSNLGFFLRDVPGGKASLTRYLEGEHNSELMAFYSWVKAKQKEYSLTGEGYNFDIPLEIAEQALHQFIYDTSPQAINVSASARLKAVTVIEKAITDGQETVDFSFARPLFVQNFSSLQNDAFCRYMSALGCKSPQGEHILADNVWAHLKITKNTINEDQFVSWAKETNTLLRVIENIGDMMCDIVSMA